MATTQSWSSPGTYTYDIPDSGAEIELVLRGGQGAPGSYNDPYNSAAFGSGSTGAKITATFDAADLPNTLTVVVGGDASGQTGGSNGGADGASASAGSNNNSATGGGGGGSTEIQDANGNRIIVAGGGGGGAAASGYQVTAKAGDAGAGGTLVGEDGTGFEFAAGGSGGAASLGTRAGSAGTADSSSDHAAAGGGGGGGATGGGGGGAYANQDPIRGGGGGGGGSHVDSAALSSSSGVAGGGSYAEVTVREKPNAPAAVNPSYISDDQLDVEIDADTSDGSIDHFDVEISRDGGAWVSPAGGPSSPSFRSDPQTESYGPAPNDYAASVGIDSTFQFRVRAVNSVGASNWTTSGTVHTSPLPPHNPSVTRPDGETWEFTFTHQSDVGGAVDFYYREDTGDGYGGWVKFDNLTGLTTGNTYTKTISTSTSSPFGAASPQADARYQWKIDTYANPGANTALRSDDAYADYGTVYFRDTVESGDLSAWDATSSAVAYQNEDSAWMGLSGADEGSYSIRISGDGYVRRNLGDLSGESDVLVRLAFAVGHADDDTEAAAVEWYDGSTWQTLASAGWASNAQGWHERHILVPDSYLSADNRLRISGFASSDGSSEAGADRVVVSNLLDEYTTPAAPSSLSLDTSTQREITGEWTDNATFETRYRHDIKRSSEGSYTDSESPADTTTHTWTGLLDGEEYDARVLAYIEQHRRGSGGTFFNSGVATATATTVLPAPTNHQFANVTRDGADHSWTNNHNYGSVKIQARHDGSGWQDVVTDLDRSTESYTIASFLHGEQYDVRVVAETEHTQTEDQ